MSEAFHSRPRARDLGITLGQLQPGPLNAITDVGGVLVGHCTIVQGDGGLVPGDGPVRTGVTAVVPHGANTFTEKVTAAVHVINGFGKAAGFIQVEECGVLETPILLTNTLSVGRVADALVDYMLQGNPAIGRTTGTVNPVVAECNDGYLNDIRGRHVKPEHVFAALRDAKGGRVTEGAVGAGTGMTAFGWKGGIGTSSRLVPVGGQADYVLGALVLTNFGVAEDLNVGGWPVGRFLPDPEAPANPGDTDHGDGSVVIIIATDAPLDARQLRRIAARAVVGIVRCGSRLSHGSGDYVIAFSTANRFPHTLQADGVRAALEASGQVALAGSPVEAVRREGMGLKVKLRPIATHLWADDSVVMAHLLRAAGEVTEEAVLNSLLQATAVVGRDGHLRRALPVERLRQLIERFESTGLG